MTAQEIAERRGRSVRTVQIQMRELLLAGDLVREGWTYIIPGAAEHDVAHCGNHDCIREASDAAARHHRNELARLRRRKATLDRRLARARTAETEAPQPAACPTTADPPPWSPAYPPAPHGRPLEPAAAWPWSPSPADAPRLPARTGHGPPLRAGPAPGS
jgi:hypothetical protein